jgi:hypothetical protein
MITAEKLPNSAPIRAGTAPLAGARFKILADLRFKLTFELFIGFKLHTIHTSKRVPVMLSVGVVAGGCKSKYPQKWIKRIQKSR